MTAPWTPTLADPARRPFRRIAAVLLAAALAGPAAVAFAAEPARGTPTAAEVLAAWKEAAGGDVWDAIEALRYSGSLTTGGFEGTFESTEDLRSGRSVARYDLGVARGAAGFDGERPWELTPSGESLVKTAPGELEEARTEAWFVARGGWFPDRRPATVEYERRAAEGDRAWHVLRVRPEGGREAEIWIAADTGRLERRVERGATQTLTTTYADWRTVVPGIRVPFRISSTRGDPGSETTLELAEIEAVAAPAQAAFLPPEVRPDDFEIAGGVNSATIPFELLNDHVYVWARVDGSEPRRFLVDTGGVNLLTSAAAAELGVEAEGAISIGGVGEAREEGGLARIDALTLGPITFHEPLFLVLPFSGLAEAEGVAFAGLVGYEVFQRFAVTVDYARRELTLTRPEAFEPPEGAIAVPFTFDGRHPVVEGAVDGVPGTFRIDTGSRSSLDLHGPFVVAHELDARYRPRLETITGWGLGGPARARVGRADLLELGEVPVRGVLVGLSAQAAGAMEDRYLAGNVGNGVLQRFTVAFDYSRQTIWLAPNGRPAVPFDRSGMWINAADGGFRVEAVVPGGPAEAAGVAVGDVVVAVDGEDARELRLPDLRRRLKVTPVGTVVRLTVVGTDGERRHASLTLRDLV